MSFSDIRYAVNSVARGSMLETTRKQLLLASDAVGLLAKIKGRNCDTCKLCVDDGGRRCRLQNPPYNFIDDSGAIGCYRTCPIEKIERG